MAEGATEASPKAHDLGERGLLGAVEHLVLLDLGVPGAVHLRNDLVKAGGGVAGADLLEGDQADRLDAALGGDLDAAAVHLARDVVGIEE